MLFPGRAAAGAAAVILQLALTGCGIVGSGGKQDLPDRADSGEGSGDGGTSTEVDFEYRGFVEVGHGDGGEYRSVDANGDGMEDMVLVAAMGDGTRALYLDLAGDGSFTYVGAPSISPLADTSADHRWMFADVDSDGRTDFLETTRNDDGTKEVYVSIADGDGWAYVGSSYTHPSNDGPLDYVSMDVNGDGRKDWIQIGQNGDGSRLLSAAYSNPDGDRLSAGGSYSTPIQDASAIYRIGNMNGDGTDDWIDISSSGDGKDIYLSLAWQDGFEYTGAPFHVGSTLPTSDWRVMDVDGDGDQDLIGVSSQDGKRVLEPFISEQQTFSAGTPIVSAASEAGAGEPAWVIGDVNGDGASDFIEIGQVADGPVTVYATVGSTGGFTRSADEYELPYSDDTTSYFAIDVTGDGRADVVAYKYWNDGSHHHGFHVLAAR